MLGVGLVGSTVFQGLEAVGTQVAAWEGTQQLAAGSMEVVDMEADLVVASLALVVGSMGWYGHILDS